MKKSPLMLAAMLAAVAASTLAQGLVEGVTESTDPAKAAAVERHAAELRSQAEMKPAAKPTKRHPAKARHMAPRTPKEPAKAPAGEMPAAK